MKLPDKPALFVRKRAELTLNQTSIAQLLQGIVEKESALRFKVKGISMYPFIKDGDLITIGPVQNKKPSLGDIVAFLHPQTKGLVIHRIIKIRGSSYYLKGDNSLEGDGPISKSNILGQVKRVERNGKRIRFGLSSEKVCIALLTRSGLFNYFLSFMTKAILIFRLQGS